MTLVTVSAEARLLEASNLEDYYRARTGALMQHILNQQAEIAELKAGQEQAEAEHTEMLTARETELSARIAALEDDLRVARSSGVTEVPTDGEQ